jgi:tRNA pseudouridine38-40 synthase
MYIVKGSIALRLYLLLHYHGTLFSGSQAQRGHSCRTVQGTLWQAFEALGLRCKVKRLHFASRTDKGVHAYGQVAELDVTPDFMAEIPDLKQALNAKLPTDLAVVDCLNKISPDEQGHYPSVQFDATAKWYRYKWILSKHRSPHHPHYALRLHQPFHVEAAQSAAQSFLGSHNFSSFKSSGSFVTNDTCLLHYASFSQQFEDEINFDVVGNRFLYKMVRNMVAYLHECGRTALNSLNIQQASPQEVLAQCSRQASLQTAPSQGLTLMAIHYESPCLQFNDARVKILSHAFEKEFSDVENLFCKTR